MPEITDPALAIELIEGHPGKRRVRVSYRLVTDAADPAAGRSLRQRIELHAVDEHDAAIPPSRRPVTIIEDTVPADAGTRSRIAEWIVDRVELDVEQDLWRTMPDGHQEPIAEWLDHLVAEVTLSDGEILVALATTPEVTGSWGALGSD
jgi:hypothetical protein